MIQLKNIEGKLFHFSDPHFSFDNTGKVMKPMDQRSWSKGTQNYVGYIDKILAYCWENVGQNDIVVITGDLGHDLNQSLVESTLKWIDDNLPGIKVLCTGNHDRNWNFALLRSKVRVRSTFLVDIGEIITVGKYTFGCYSDHSKEVDQADDTKEWYGNNDEEVLKVGQRIMEQANKLGTIPVFISHYPTTGAYEKLGELGIRFYLSGHVHVTSNKAESGTDWTWYNRSVKDTDDTFVKGMYCSTGTTDVLLQKHGVIVKRLPTEQIKLEKPRTTARDEASRLFGCHPALAKPFNREDPFNENTITGFVCIQKGNMQGSIYITHVNGKETEPQLIYGVPKMLYPYKAGTIEIEIPKAYKYVFYEKVNGMNVLFFKYKDSNGQEFLTAKSKGAPLLSDSEYGPFLTLTKKVLDKDAPLRVTVLGNLLMSNKNIQSISFELFGQEEPHLVKYDNDIGLRPLFFTRPNGDIVSLGCPQDLAEDRYEAANAIKDLQEQAFSRNENFRKENNLPIKYEYNHFATEGYVMYPVDEHGTVINRCMYKVKPKDIEEVHWQNFDKDISGRVREALKKIGEAGEEATEARLQTELDMGPKEWSKWGNDVMKFVSEATGRKNHVVVMVGLPGSGKSTYAEALNKVGGKYTRICQDELGSANACKDAMVAAILRGEDVVIDRTNIDERQRKRWIDLAHKYGVTNITCVLMDVPLEECIHRVKERKDHPTINDTMPDEAKEKIVRMFHTSFTLPKVEEGFASLAVMTPKKEVDENEKS